MRHLSAQNKEAMKEDVNNSINFLLSFGHVGIALIAGIMKELNRVNTLGFSFKRTMINGLVGAFVGLMSGFLCLNWNVPIYLSFFIVSISGWLGGNLLDFFGLILKKFIANKFDVTVTVDEEVKHSELVNKG